MVSEAVLRVAEETVLRRVGLAEDHRARLLDPLDDDRVVGPDAVGEDEGAARRADTFGHFEILDGDRQPVQRAEVVAPRDGTVGLGGHLQGEIGRNGEVGVELRVERGDAI